MQRNRRVTRDDPRAVVNPGGAQHLLRNPEPAAGADDGRIELAGTLLAHAAVADVDDPVRDLRRRRIVADEDRRGAVLGRKLRQQGQNLARRGRVEIPVGSSAIRSLGR